MKTFTTDEVCEILNVRASDINYLLYTYRLTLASDLPGKLNPRQFCAFDVYVLALAFDLIRLSGRREEVCRAIEHFLWWNEIDSADEYRKGAGFPALTAAERLTMRSELANRYALDSTAAGECFKRHERQWPWLIVGVMQNGKLHLRAVDDSGLWHFGFLGHRALYIVNITDIIAQVDEALAAMEDA